MKEHLSAVLVVALAVGLWFIIFSPITQNLTNFWALLTASTLILSSLGYLLNRKEMRELLKFQSKPVFIGVLSVPILYAIFYLGHQGVNVLLGQSGEVMVEVVYHSRSQAPLWLISLLLLFIIGPCEEIFWRGFLQWRLSHLIGQAGGLISATLVYGLVHAWSGNPVLILAAGVAGFFWGLLFMVTQSLWAPILSHALWDLFVFVLFPLV